MKSIGSLVIRFAGLGTRFALLGYLAMFFSEADVGLFGLVTATTMIAVYALGLEYHVVNTRTILSSLGSEKGPLIRDQLVLHLLSYILFAPALSLVFLFDLLPWDVFFLVYLLAITEHLSQECFRLLLVLEFAPMANMILFVRQALWVFPFVALSEIEPSLRDMRVLFVFWLGGGALSVFITWRFLSVRRIGQTMGRGVDWQRLRLGLRAALPFFLSSGIVVVIQYVDRYFVRAFTDFSLLGVYTLFGTASNVAHTLVYTGVISILFPRLMSAYYGARKKEYREAMGKLASYSVGMLALFSVLAALFAMPLISMLDRPLYAQNLDILYYLFIAVFLNILSQLPHYILYVEKKDKQIVISAVLAFITCLVGSVLFVPEHGIHGAAGVSVASFGILCCSKMWFARHGLFDLASSR